jgi:hypothetical protein
LFGVWCHMVFGGDAEWWWRRGCSVGGGVAPSL